MCGEIKDTDGNGRLQWQTGSNDAHLDVLTAQGGLLFLVGITSKSLYIWL